MFLYLNLEFDWERFCFVVCCVGEEPPESLFMKELKRRGMTPTSLLQDYEVDQDEIKTDKETGNSSKTTATTPAFDKSLLNQRERSLALNSEGLEVRLTLVPLLVIIVSHSHLLVPCHINC